jgi:membrane protease YdiL (CAAX protease family)
LLAFIGEKMNLKILDNPKLFFSEWFDDKDVFIATAWVSMILMVLLLWFQSNVPELKNTADIYWNFLLIGIILGGIDFIAEKNILFSFLFTGKTIKTAIFALIGGLLTGFLLNSTSLVIATPLAINIPASLASFVFVVLIAPYAEEKFFRAAFYPTSVQIFKRILNVFFKVNDKQAYLVAGLFSIFLVSGAFAFFHLAAFGANPSLVFSAFLFSVIVIIGNRVSESFYFGVGTHLMNNFITFGGISVLMGFFK